MENLSGAPEWGGGCVHRVFPGLRLYFLRSPDLIGKEPEESDADPLVLHYCHAGRLLVEHEQGHSGLASGDVWIVPRPSEGEAPTLLSKRYAGVSLLLEPETAQEPVCSCVRALLGGPFDLLALGESLRQHRGRVIPGSDRLGTVFAQLFLGEPPYGESYFRLKAIELLLHLAAWEPKQPKENPPYLERELIERAEEVCRYLTAHLDCRLTQAQVAKQFHMSLTALKYAFRRRYGLTMDAYLRQQRISAAKQLLLESELPVSEIAHCVGYESHSQFTAVFRSCQGLTPREYRKKQGKE